MLARFADY